MEWAKEVDSHIKKFLSTRQEGVSILNDLLKDFKELGIKGKVENVTDSPLTWHVQLDVRDVGILKFDIQYADIKKSSGEYNEVGSWVQKEPSNEEKVNLFRKAIVSQVKDKLKI